MASNGKNMLEKALKKKKKEKKRKRGVTYAITWVLSAGQKFPLTTR